MSYNNKTDLQPICKECGNEYDKLGSLHKHIKVHDMTMGEYYVKNFPRKSLYSQNQIPFQNINQYFSDSFCSQEEERLWIENGDQEKVKEYIISKYKKEILKKGMSFVPFYNYSKCSNYIPDVEVCQRFFGNFSSFCKEVGKKPFYSKKLPRDFWEAKVLNQKFLIDTREQLPFKYENSISCKLDVGDYTLAGDSYNYTFVDRKSISDFIGTMIASNYERFQREMDRCKELESKLFVVVEGSLSDVEKKKKSLRQQRATIEYIWNNMRQMQLKYKDVCQFVFCLDRQDAADITARILYFGESVWDCDLQYFINNRK